MKYALKCKERSSFEFSRFPTSWWKIHWLFSKRIPWRWSMSRLEKSQRWFIAMQRFRFKGRWRSLLCFTTCFASVLMNWWWLLKNLLEIWFLWMCYRFNASLLIKTHQNQNLPRKLWRSQCVAINYAITINLNISPHMEHHVFMGIVWEWYRWKPNVCTNFVCAIEVLVIGNSGVGREIGSLVLVCCLYLFVY